MCITRKVLSSEYESMQYNLWYQGKWNYKHLCFDQLLTRFETEPHAWTQSSLQSVSVKENICKVWIWETLSCQKVNHKWASQWKNSSKNYCWKNMPQKEIDLRAGKNEVDTSKALQKRVHKSIRDRWDVCGWERWDVCKASI